MYLKTPQNWPVIILIIFCSIIASSDDKIYIGGFLWPSNSQNLPTGIVTFQSGILFPCEKHFQYRSCVFNCKTNILTILNNLSGSGLSLDDLAQDGIVMNLDDSNYAYYVNLKERVMQKILLNDVPFIPCSGIWDRTKKRCLMGVYENDDSVTLHLFDFSTTSTTVLAKNIFSFAYIEYDWINDHEIVFLKIAPPRIRGYADSVEIMDIQTFKTTTIAKDINCSNLRLSSDKRYLAYDNIMGDNAVKVLVYDLNTSRMIFTKVFEGAQYYVSFLWCPDNRHLLVNLVSMKKNKLIVFSVLDPEDEALTINKYPTYGLAAFLDNQSLYISERFPLKSAKNKNYIYDMKKEKIVDRPISPEVQYINLRESSPINFEYKEQQ